VCAISPWRLTTRASSSAAPEVPRRPALESHNELLRAAIEDIGDSVRANDAKASAALVLHGLVFAGITTLLTQLGGAYRDATGFEQVVGIGMLGVTFAAFLASALCLIDAVSPYRPTRLDERLEARYRHVFFPPATLLGAADPHGEMSRLLDEMGEAEVRDELVAETLKLADILNYESAQTARGYRLLRLELAAAAAFFAVVAIVSL
jgi:hypothetical protein